MPFSQFIKIIKHFIPSGSLKSQTAKSGVWVSATKIGIRVFQTLLWLIMARLLGPSAIGLVAISLLILNGLDRFSRLGIDTALIQREEQNINHLLDTAWILKIGRGVILAGITLLLSPLLAEIFEFPELRNILPIIALSPLVLGFRNPAVVYFRKHLEFHKQFAYRISATLVEFIVAIILALLWGNVWAMIIAYIAADVTFTVISYVLHSYRPNFQFNISITRELINYGKWITAGGIIYYLISDGDDFLVGALLPSAALGYYRLAYRMGNAPATEISQIVSNIMFPTYSRLQNNIDELREAYFMVVRLISFITFPMAVGIISVTPEFVNGILGPQWVPMITTMRIIALYGLLYSISSTLGPVWNALGRPDIGVKIGLIRLSLIAILIYPATTAYGIEGTAIVVLLAYIFPTGPIDIYLLSKLINTSYSRFISELMYPLFVSTLMGLTVLGIKPFIVSTELYKFGILVFIGVVSYAIFVIIVEYLTDWGLKRTLNDVFEAVRA